MSEPGRVRQVAGEHVRAAHANCAMVAATAERAHQTDAVRHQQRRGLQRAAKVGVPPRQHDHLGVEGDHERRRTLGVVAMRLHHVDE